MEFSIVYTCGWNHTSTPRLTRNSHRHHRHRLHNISENQSWYAFCTARKDVPRTMSAVDMLRIASWRRNAFRVSVSSSRT